MSKTRWHHGHPLSDNMAREFSAWISSKPIDDRAFAEGDRAFISVIDGNFWHSDSSRRKVASKATVLHSLKNLSTHKIVVAGDKPR